MPHMRTPPTQHRQWDYVVSRLRCCAVCNLETKQCIKFMCGNVARIGMRLMCLKGHAFLLVHQHGKMPLKLPESFIRQLIMRRTKINHYPGEHVVKFIDGSVTVATLTFSNTTDAEKVCGIWETSKPEKRASLSAPITLPKLF